MKKLLLLLLACAGTYLSFAQVAISSAPAIPNASAMLDIISNKHGVLVPRMTSTERVTNIGSPANGLLVYDVTTSSFWVFKTGTGWVEIVSTNLPFSATVNSANAFPNAAFRIINTNSATGSAATFQINNSSNSGSALSATTDGTGNAFRAQVSNNTAATAIFGRATGSSLGAAGSFVNDNAANTNVAVGIFNNAANINAHALIATHTGGGRAASFTINSASNASSALRSTTNGIGRAGDFSINNASNNSNALFATTNGTGSALRAEVSAGTNATAIIGLSTASSLGRAGLFINDNAANTNKTVTINTNATNSVADALYVNVTGKSGAGVFEVTNPAHESPAVLVTSNGQFGSRSLTANHFGLGMAADFGIYNTANNSDALTASTIGDGYAGRFTNAKADATNSGGIIASTNASTGNGYPNAIYAAANGTLGTAGLFQSTNSGNVRPTMLVLNEGVERNLVVSANNSSFPAAAVQVNVSGTNATTDSRGLQVNQAGLGMGIEIQAGNAANTSDVLAINSVGTGTTLHSINTNLNGTGSAGVFEKSSGVGSAYTNNPTCELEVRHPLSGQDGLTGFRIFNKGGNSNAWTFYTQNSTGNLLVFANGILRGNFNAGTGAYTSTSDARFKSSVTTMPDMLADLMKLQPKTYYYTSDKNRKVQLGFLAQQVEPLFPQVVYKNMSDKGDETYTIDYSAFGVIAIKAVQEQQKIIEDKQQQIDALSARMEKLEKLLAGK